ncbi:MAG: hypothetical protein KDD40_01790 [Bdellovibrionales bacterium]|nr:hypothetical protein [Bdellovibrionales bacterium]
MAKGIIKFFILVLSAFFMSIPTYAKDLPQELPVKRGPASFAQGFRVLHKKCSFRSSPKKSSQELFQVKAGRKIWFTAIDSQWLLAKTKNNTREVYLHSSCVK